MSGTTKGPVPDELIESLGREDAESMQGDLAALANLCSVHAMHILSEEDSEAEALAEKALADAIEALVGHPRKAVDLISAMLGLVLHQRMGQTYMSYFEAVGVKPWAIRNSQTGEER